MMTKAIFITIMMLPLFVNCGLFTLDAYLREDYKFWLGDIRCDDFYGQNYTDNSHKNDTESQPHVVTSFKMKDGQIIYSEYDTIDKFELNKKVYKDIDPKDFSICIGKSSSARGFYVNMPQA